MSLTFKNRPELLLHPNIPKPLHTIAPRTVLGDQWWQAERKAAYRKSLYHCQACGVWKHQAKFHRWLEAHETYDIDYAKGRMTYVETVALCNACHNYIHSGRLEMLLNTGKITHQRYVAVIQHGDEVLKDVKRDQHKWNEAKIASWSQWRLVVFGKSYKGRFKNYKEWESYHNE